MTDPQLPTQASRRIVFQGLGALGVAVVLAGCAGSDDGADGGSSGGGTVDAGAELTPTADVPVGGGVVLAEQKVVVTQPTKGDFQAFTAVCTHQQQTVTSVDGGTIVCSHHGSEYDAATGEVTGGPAPSALAKVPIKVEGGKILAA